MPRRFITLDDYRLEARKRLPRMIFDYIEGGAGSETGLARNIAAFKRSALAPKRLRDVSRRDQRVAPFGTYWASPFAVAPMGLNGVSRPDGDLILARAAGRAGIPFCLSTASTSTVEAVADIASGDLWFQLYVVQAAFAARMVNRAADAGCKTLVVTVDVPVNGERLRDKRNGFGLPFRFSPGMMVDVARHPRWAIGQLWHGRPTLAHFTGDGGGDGAGGIEAQAALMNRQMDASFDWAALARLRDAWKGVLLVKGILRLDDARRCIALGADGVIVSNHGGRQLDAALSALEALPTVAAGAGAPVLMDSGIRSGYDVLMALACGAQGALIGRPLLYALAAGGEAAVDELLALLREQVDAGLALTGCARAVDVDGDLLWNGPCPGRTAEFQQGDIDHDGSVSG